MKECRECNTLLPLSEYYKHKSMKDGHLNKCKGCVKSRVGGHRKDNIERIREYDRKRGNRQSANYPKEWRKGILRNIRHTIQ